MASNLDRVERWQHHHKRLHQLIEVQAREWGILYHAGNHYSGDGVPNADKLRARQTRLFRLIDLCDQRRERYAVRSMSSLYRAWP